MAEKRVELKRTRILCINILFLFKFKLCLVLLTAFFVRFISWHYTVISFNWT